MKTYRFKTATSATWDAIALRPDYFAAAVPIAGGGDPQMAEQWKELPIWAFASAGDQTCPVVGTSTKYMSRYRYLVTSNATDVNLTHRH
ncbi:hypothetical protein [Stieleria varia]|uniref:Alpha/beta hydrolase family protein n=1 Tax=Stieleria varia TaxID=2528005 RepID=A0A5C6AXX7_9BACT|nr:hypothetical protein [Stieleria varia]TWU04773.1 hypothetical protein Pla52n_28170 [Stieleria varia]